MSRERNGSQESGSERDAKLALKRRQKIICPFDCMGTLVSQFKH